MDDHRDAVALAIRKNTWQTMKIEYDPSGRLLLKQEITPITDLELWDGLNFKLHAVVTRYTNWDSKNKQYIENYGVLVSTKKYAVPETMVEHYNLRVHTEERFRQFKLAWHIAEFSSPCDSLIESHVCFTLLTYSLLQLYLQRKDLQKKTTQMINTLRADESLGKDAVLVYAQDNYGVFDLDDYTIKVADLEELPKEKLKTTMVKQKENRLARKQ